jgi:hypothetical protein
MSLTSPRLIFPITALALAALMVASCGQQDLPSAPTRMTALSGQQPVVAEFTVYLVDDTPPPPPPGSEPSPWPPGAPPRAQPGVPVPIDPTTHERLHVKLDPDPVAHSGAPIPIRGCRDNRFTWFYDQIVATDTGVPIKITKRENFFDGRYTSTNHDSFSVPGNSSVILRTRWCSAYPIPHYAQTKFFGADEYNNDFIYSAPRARLKSPM